jgi:hypothetical protein
MMGAGCCVGLGHAVILYPRLAVDLRKTSSTALPRSQPGSAEKCGARCAVVTVRADCAMQDECDDIISAPGNGPANLRVGFSSPFRTRDLSPGSLGETI